MVAHRADGVPGGSLEGGVLFARGRTRGINDDAGIRSASSETFGRERDARTRNILICKCRGSYWLGYENEVASLRKILYARPGWSVPISLIVSLELGIYEFPC